LKERESGLREWRGFEAKGRGREAGEMNIIFHARHVVGGGGGWGEIKEEKTPKEKGMPSARWGGGLKGWLIG